jgi:hypothetical protein
MSLFNAMISRSVTSSNSTQFSTFLNEKINKYHDMLKHHLATRKETVRMLGRHVQPNIIK